MAASKSIVEVYTDWANHYLQKSGDSMRITDIRKDLQQGTILAKVIEAVTNDQSLMSNPSFDKNPKNEQDCVKNVQMCLDFLVARKVAVAEIGAQNIVEGQLKAILGLFFQLSRYKQLQRATNTTTTSSTTSSTSTTTCTTSTARPTRLAAPKSVLSRQQQARRPAQAGANRGQGESRAQQQQRQVQGQTTNNTALASNNNGTASNNSTVVSNNSGGIGNSGVAGSRLARPKLTKSSGIALPKGKSALGTRHYNNNNNNNSNNNNNGSNGSNGSRVHGSVYGSVSKPGLSSLSSRLNYQLGSRTSSSSEFRPSIATSSSSRSSSSPSTMRRSAGKSANKHYYGPIDEPRLAPKPPLRTTSALQTRPSSAMAANNVYANLDVTKNVDTVKNVDNVFMEKDDARSVESRSLPRRQNSRLTSQEEQGVMANVAVVSPMPSLRRNKIMLKESTELDNEEEEEQKGLKQLVPMRPIHTDKAVAMANNDNNPYLQPSLLTGVERQSEDTACRTGLDIGYMSDGCEAFRPSVDAFSSEATSALDDGYLSEGGASVYARRIQSRIAAEKQRVVAQHNNNNNDNNNVVDTNAVKNVEKSKNLPTTYEAPDRVGSLEAYLRRSLPKEPSDVSSLGVPRRSSTTWMPPSAAYALSLGKPHLEAPHHGSQESPHHGSQESLCSVTSSIQMARANSTSKTRMLMRQRGPKSTSALTNKTSDANLKTRPSLSSFSALSQENPYYGLPLNKEDEVARLRKELAEEQEKVSNLSSQLVTNAHVVAAFEQSLANMTSRLQLLTATSEQKDSELNELRSTIDQLRQSGRDAGLLKTQKGSPSKKKSENNANKGKDGINSAQQVTSLLPTTPRRSGWLRHSFSRAFASNHTMKSGLNSSKMGKKAKTELGANNSFSDVEETEPSNETSLPRAASVASGNVDSNLVLMSPESVAELKRQLMEKDSQLTETRLEALTSAHQLESLRETVSRMKNEMMSLKSDNERMQETLQKERLSSQSSLNTTVTRIDDQSSNELRRVSVTLSESSLQSGPSSLDLSNSTDPMNRDGGKLVSVSVALYENFKNDSNKNVDFLRIGVISVSGKTSWALLDGLVQRLFKEYVMRVDPVSNLGLSAEAIHSYNVGEISRCCSEESKPEYLPYGYLVGDITDVQLKLKNVDKLALISLVSKTIMEEIIDTVKAQRRIVIQGLPGTGKANLARKIGLFLTDFKPQLIESFDMGDIIVDELVSKNDFGPTKVLVLTNLQFCEDLSRLVSFLEQKSSLIMVATMDTLEPGLTSLPKSWLYSLLMLEGPETLASAATHVGRALRQKLLSVETRTRVHNAEMAAVIEFVSRIHALLLAFSHLLWRQFEIYSRIDANSFIKCPVSDVGAVRKWFLVHLWTENLEGTVNILDQIEDEATIKAIVQLWNENVWLKMRNAWPWTESVEDVHITELEEVLKKPKETKQYVQFHN